jgi:DNA-binding NtrC family response regulator
MMPVDPCSVLLVDDETAFIEPLMKRLLKRGLSAAGCSSGEEALRHLAGESVDVVVLDVKMPGMSGIETLRQIKKEHPLVEVIMMTGHASVEVAIEGMELGAFDYLMKPTDFDDLLFKIQDARQKKSIQETKIEKLR